MKTTRIGLIFLFVGLALTGCRSVPPHALMALPPPTRSSCSEHSIDQVRDEDSGEHYYVVCKACARPTLKTRYRPAAPLAIARFEPAPIAPAVVVKEPPSEAPMPVQETPIRTRRRPTSAWCPSDWPDKLGPLEGRRWPCFLEEAKAAERVHVRGYTDILGRMPGNKRLAMARAEEIRAFLIKGGVDETKLSTSYCIDCFVEPTNRMPVARPTVALSSSCARQWI